MLVCLNVELGDNCFAIYLLPRIPYQSAHESLLPEAPKQIRLWLFVAESCRLLAQVAATFGIVSEEEEGPDRQVMAGLIVPPSLRRDWDEFFAPGAYSVLFPIFFTVAGKSVALPSILSSMHTVRKLVLVLNWFPQ